jgi:hypothetical protein
MLAAWTEILPLFIVRWLALQLCERVVVGREASERMYAVARPDVLAKVTGQGGAA